MIRNVSLVCFAAMAGAPAAAAAQACPSGRPSPHVVRSTWVEPYAPDTVFARLVRAVTALGYPVAIADTTSRRLTTGPHYRWPGNANYSSWQSLTHPGMAVSAVIDTSAQWASISLELKVLCDTDDNVPPGLGPPSTVEDHVAQHGFAEVHDRLRNLLGDERSEIAGSRCAPLPEGDRKLRICKALARARPQDLVAQLDYAFALIRFFQAPEARAVVERALALSDRPRELYDSVGSVMLAEGEHEEAVRLFRGALRRWPNDAAVHRVLGYGLLGERKHWEALESFERSIALDATDPAAHYGAAVALDAQQRHEEAKRRCTNADQLYQARLRQQPRDWAAWVALGRCAVIAEQWARATAYFERAAQIDRARLQANEDLMKEITRSRVISGPQDPAPVP